MTIDIHISVVIDTSAGSFTVVTSSPISVFADSSSLWYPTGGVLSYPDQRAKSLRVWADLGSGFECVADHQLSESRTYNVSYVILDDPIDLSSAVNADPFPSATPGGFVQKNRVMISEVNEPRIFDPARVYFAGKSGQDAITGFAVNALPLSEGQFGQYPLYVFTKNSVWALEQSQDSAVAFARMSPASLHRGAFSQGAITNVGRTVCVADEDGVYLLGRGDPNEIGRAINEGLGTDVKLAYWKDGNIGELWVSSGSDIFVYNLHYERWYTINRAEVSLFFRKNRDLYLVDTAGNITSEANSLATAVNVSFTLDPVHFGQPDRMKRIWALYVRGVLADPSVTLEFESGGQFSGDALFIRPRYSSDYSFTLEVAGDMTPGAGEYLHRVDAEFDSRYRRRQRSTPQS